MSKVNLAIKTLISSAKSPSSIVRSSSSAFSSLIETTKKTHVSERYSLPNGLPTVDILDLCPGLDEDIYPYTYLEGTSLPTDLALLKRLARDFQGCDYFEIGTWRGESILNVAEVASSCTSLSLSNEQMAELGIPADFIHQNRLFSGGDRRIVSIEANSLKFDFSSINGKFDLIFVDGDHSYDAVKSDTSNVFKLLKDENSMIVWHDYAFNPERVRYSVLAGILDGCPEEERKHLYHVSNTMCAIYMKRSYPLHHVNFPSVPNKKFKVRISAESWSS